MTRTAGVSVREAALRMGVSIRTVQQWVRRGAPTVRPGGVGRGKSALVEIAALERFRGDLRAVRESAPCAPDLEVIARALHGAYWRPQEGRQAPTWRLLGLKPWQASAVLCAALQSIARELAGRYLSEGELPQSARELIYAGIDAARRIPRAEPNAKNGIVILADCLRTGPGAPTGSGDDR